MGDVVMEELGAATDGHAVVAQKLAAFGFQNPAVEAVALRRRGGFDPRVLHPAAPQDGAYTRDQLPAAKGFWQVVVGAHLQADDTVNLLAFGG